MNTKRFYVIVAIDVKSNNEITEDIIQEIAEEMHYSFNYENDNPLGIKNNLTVIINTEIQDVSTVSFI